MFGVLNSIIHYFVKIAILNIIFIMFKTKNNVVPNIKSINKLKKIIIFVYLILIFKKIASYKIVC